jgi:hypothetical protein
LSKGRSLVAAQLHLRGESVSAVQQAISAAPLSSSSLVATCLLSTQSDQRARKTALSTVQRWIANVEKGQARCAHPLDATLVGGRLPDARLLELVGWCAAQPGDDGWH